MTPITYMQLGFSCKVRGPRFPGGLNQSPVQAEMLSKMPNYFRPPG